MAKELDPNKDIDVWNGKWSRDSWYPDEQVVRFIAGHYNQRIGMAGRYLKPKQNKTDLIGVDFGCGPGRHMLTLPALLLLTA